jgi:NB-ARC domain
LNIKGEEQICLNADHSNIVRFKSADDDNFKIVLDKLRNLVQSIAPTPHRRRGSQVYVPFMPGKFFVGRKAELSQLESWFLEAERPVFKAVALYGPSGVGKTQLALKFAIDYQDSYDYVFFVNASSLKVLRNEFTKLQKNLMLAEGSGDAVTELTNWLVSQTEQRWLLVFDNANSLKDVLPVVTPIVHAGHVILTTQDARVGNSEFINEALEVKVLSPEESQQLLFTRGGVGSPKLNEIEVAQALVEELGYLPLAIDSAGAYINVRQKTVTEYTDLFHNFQKDILDLRPQASSYKQSVIGTLELNFKEIDSRPGSYALLCLFVFLDGIEVTEEFLKRGATNQLRWGPSGEPILADPADRYIPYELINLINNDLKFDGAIEELISLSIIRRAKRGKVGRVFSLHPLFCKCAKLRMTEEQRHKYSRDALIFLAHAFPSGEYVLEKGQVPPAICKSCPC